MRSPLLPIGWWPLVIAKWLPALLPAGLRERMCPRHVPGPWKSGVTVVIPDRDSPDLLADCLEALMPALALIDEPWQVLVSTSGAPASKYAEICRSHPYVEWCHSDSGLGYSRAIAQAIPAIRYDHTYLLNNDMRLHTDALAHVLGCRGADVFAVASQILMADGTVRREETGLTACNGFTKKTTLFDVEPGDDRQPRTHLYAGGGSSLFRSAPLRDFARQSLVYEPVYWEDVEWGLRAWREGWRVLFCPLSHAVHRHRVTVSRLFPAHEIERLFERNGHWFDLRNDGASQLRSHVTDLRRNSFSASETRCWSFALATAAAGLRSRGHSIPDDWFIAKHAIRTAFSAASDARPRVLFVSDHALTPARSVRTRYLLEQLEALAESFNVAVVARNAGEYVSEAIRAAPFLTSLWLIDSDSAVSADATADGRLPADVQEAVLRARRSFRPDHVVFDDQLSDANTSDDEERERLDHRLSLTALSFPGSRRLHAFQKAFACVAKNGKNGVRFPSFVPGPV